MTESTNTNTPIMDDADLSECSTYRWSLTRRLDLWGDGNCLFIMLNPSTADAMLDDPTIRRCKAFATDWGHQKLTVVNLFSFRATDPTELKTAADPIGHRTNEIIAAEAATASTIVCAWGAHGGLMDRDREVTDMLKATGAQLQCLNVTKDGFPCHPLYQPKACALKPYGGRS